MKIIIANKDCFWDTLVDIYSLRPLCSFIKQGTKVGMDLLTNTIANDKDNS